MKAMTFKLGNLELSIKVKDQYLNEKFNEKDTMAFINLLSILLYDSAEVHRIAYRQKPTMECFKRMADLRHKEATDLFRQLEKLEYYDDIWSEEEKKDVED